MQTIVIFGGGGHAKVVLDIIRKQGAYSVMGVLDARLPVGQKILGYPVIGRDEDLPGLMKENDIHGAIVAVGKNALRNRIVESVRRFIPEIRFVNAFHPSAQVGDDVVFGVGNVVMAGAIINSGTRIGDHCVFNTACSIDHDCSIHDFVSFAPNSCAAGNVCIRPFSEICVGVNIAPNVEVGSRTVVGAGATVIRDLPSGILAYGTPARRIRTESDS